MARLNQELPQFGEYHGAPPEVCLMAILRETGGIAARAFAAMGVDREQLRRDLAAVVPPPSRFGLAEITAQGTLSPVEQDIYRRYPYHGTLHDLAMVLRDVMGNIAKVFAKHHINIDRVRDQALQLADTDGASEGGTSPWIQEQTYEQILELFQSTDPKHRSDASFQLMSKTQFELGDEGKAKYACIVIPILKQRLRDPIMEVRWHAVKTLASYASHAPEVNDLLRGMLQDANMTVRIEAAVALSELTRDLSEILPTIREAYRGEDDVVRTMAGLALARITKQCDEVPAEFLDILADNLRSTEYIPVLQAISSIAQLGPKARALVPAVTELLDKVEGMTFVNAVVTPGIQITPNEQIVVQLLHTLTLISTDTTALVARLSPLLDDDRKGMQRAALAGLAKLGEVARAQTPRIERFVASDDLVVRVQAVATRWQISGEANHLPAFLELLTHDDPDTAVAAMRIVYALGPAADATVPTFETLLSATNLLVRTSAANVLRHLDKETEHSACILEEAANSAELKHQAIFGSGGVRGGPLHSNPAAHRHLIKTTKGESGMHVAPPTDPFQVELDLWNDAIRTDPNDSQAFLLRGHVHERGKRFDEALADYERCGALEPDNPFRRDRHVELLNQRAIARRKEGAYDRALADYTAAIRLAPEVAVLYQNRAKTYLKLDDLEKAFADLERAYALKPENEKVCNDFAWQLATVRDERFRAPARALALAKQACAATAHREPHVLDTLAVAYATLGEFESALQWIEKALALNVAGSPSLQEVLEKHRQLIVEKKSIES